MGRNVGHILYLIACISLIIGIFISLSAIAERGSRLNEDERYDLEKAKVFYLFAIAAAVLGLCASGAHKGF